MTAVVRSRSLTILTNRLIDLALHHAASSPRSAPRSIGNALAYRERRAIDQLDLDIL